MLPKCVTKDLSKVDKMCLVYALYGKSPGDIVFDAEDKMENYRSAAKCYDARGRPHDNKTIEKIVNEVKQAL